MTEQERETLFATEVMTPAYVRRFMLARDLDNTKVLGALTGPVLFTRGSKDMTMPTEALARIMSAMPKAKLSTYEGASHLTFIEQTDRFDRELAAFANEAHAQ